MMTKEESVEMTGPISYYPPTVIEQTARGERQYDIYSRLLIDRIVFLGTQVTDQVANVIVAQFLFLEQVDPEAPIQFFINSPGGSVYSGLAIYDIMQHVTCPVHTYCVGLAASMGALLLTAGAKDHRYCLPHSRVMIHQPLGGAQGQASDIEIQAKEVLELKKQLNNIFVHHSKLSYQQVEKETDRDNYLSPQKAIEFGIIDSVIEKKKVSKTKES